MKRKKQDYAMYKGDKLLAIGTADELAALRGVKVKTIYHYATAQYKRRTQGSGSNNRLNVVALGVDDDI